MHTTPERTILARLFWRKGLFLFALMLGGLLFFSTSCAKKCTKDENCDKHFRCGPGQYCLSACFVGETNACIEGYLCDTTGQLCVKGTTSKVDAGFSSEAKTEPEIAENQPPEQLPTP